MFDEQEIICSIHVSVYIWDDQGFDIAISITSLFKINSILNTFA
jgi:hypothetical protein